jgi:lipopolysaccharide/colanic/teichoic acid biosynthesis glycosyltransferase
MGTIDSSNIEYKIAPPESLFIIGSNSINENGDFYFVDVANINNPVNKRNKRLFDIAMSITLLITSPIIILLTNKKIGFLQNIFQVLLGFKSWVGRQSDEEKIFKGLKKGVLSPAMMIKSESHESTRERLNALYAKDFKIWNDLKLVIRNLKFLGE